jgi:hypothetical protein
MLLQQLLYRRRLIPELGCERVTFNIQACWCLVLRDCVEGIFEV